MRLPRNLSGRELLGGLERAFGYRKVHQEGSHVILETGSPRHHRIAIPDHRALRLGTLNGILRAVAQAQGLPKEEVIRLLFG
jgi:predicted RNA binding protein YcfA (HicA-like mRNA interferase family)